MERTNLTPERSRLFGRADAARELERSLDGHRALTLVGPGGAGKTRLARQVAWATRGRHPHGVWFVDLSAARSVHEVLAQLAGYLGACPATVDAVGAALARCGRTLVILDHAELLADDLVPMVEHWSAIDAPVRFLLTSRRRMPIRGSACLRLGPLAPDEAAALLERRVTERGGALAAADRAALPALIARLDALPGALEVAAAHAGGTMSVVELLAHLERFGQLPDPGDGASSSFVAPSWTALDASARAALAALAQVPGSIAADGLAAAMGEDPETARRALARLLDHSLVVTSRAESEPDRARFSPYQGVRDYVARAAADDGPWRRYAAWLIAEGERRLVSMDLGSPGQRFIEAERAGLVAVLDRETERSPDLAAAAIRLLEGSWMYHDPRSYHARIGQLLDTVGSRMSRHRAMVCRTLVAAAASRLGRADEALAAFAVAAAQLDPASDPPQVGLMVASRYSIFAFERGDGALALEVAERALRDFGGGSPLSLGALHVGAGNARRLLGDVAGAARSYQAAYDLSAESPQIRAAVLGNLALVSPVREAIVRCRQALDLLPPRSERAYCTIRADLAALLAFSGAYDEARAHAERAHADAEAIERVDALHTATLVLAELDRRAGDARKACERIDRALVDLRWSGGERGVLVDFRGTLHHEVGELDEAEAAYQAALAMFPSVSPDDRRLNTWLHLAALRAARGDAPGAAHALDQARAVPDPPPVGSLRRALIERYEALVHLADPSVDPRPVERVVLQPIPEGQAPTVAWWEGILVQRFAGALLRRRSAPRPVLRLAPGGAGYTVGDLRVDLDRFPLLARLVRGLAAAHRDRPGEPLGVEELIDSGWPGERVLYHAGRARVYVAIRRLRELGLREILLTRDGGYLIDPRVDVEAASGAPEPGIALPSRQ